MLQQLDACVLYDYVTLSVKCIYDIVSVYISHAHIAHNYTVCAASKSCENFECASAVRIAPRPFNRDGIVPRIDLVNMESKKSVVAAEAAHAVIRKFFVPLHKAVTDDYVQMELYAGELIDKATLKLGEPERGRRILFDLQEKTSQKMDDGVINELCKILDQRKDDQMGSLVQDIRGKATIYFIKFAGHIESSCTRHNLCLR